LNIKKPTSNYSGIGANKFNTETKPDAFPRKVLKWKFVRCILSAFYIELIVPKETISFGRNWHLGLSRLPEDR